jgi:hypothetical protein
MWGVWGEEKEKSIKPRDIIMTTDEKPERWCKKI